MCSYNNIYLTGRLGFDLHLTLYEAEQDKKLEHSNEVFSQVLYWICVRLGKRGRHCNIDQTSKLRTRFRVSEIQEILVRIL